jgi:hypothetical protein
MPVKPDLAAITAAAGSSGARITLRLDAAEKVCGAGSFLKQTARGRADQVEISTSVIPSDKDGFRASVLAFLSDNMKGDAGFTAAPRVRQVTVHSVDEVPELTIQPMVSFELYKNGYHQGGGTFSPEGANVALFHEMGKTRGQAFGSLGSSQFVAIWSKPA